MSFPLSLLSGSAAAVPPDHSGPLQVKPRAADTGDGSSQQGPQEQSFADVMVQSDREALAADTVLVLDDQSTENAEPAPAGPDAQTGPERTAAAAATPGKAPVGEIPVESASGRATEPSDATDLGSGTAFMTNSIATGERGRDPRGAESVQNPNGSNLLAGDPQQSKAREEGANGNTRQRPENGALPASMTPAVTGDRAAPERVAKSAPADAVAQAPKDGGARQSTDKANVRQDGGPRVDAVTRSSTPKTPSTSGSELTERGDGQRTPRHAEGKAKGPMPPTAADMPSGVQKTLSPLTPQSAWPDDKPAFKGPAVQADGSSGRMEAKAVANVPQAHGSDKVTAMTPEAIARAAQIKEWADSGRTMSPVSEDAKSTQPTADIKPPVAAKAVPASATQIAITYNLSTPAGITKLKTEPGRTVSFETTGGPIPSELTGLQSPRIVDDSGARILNFDTRIYAGRPDAMSNDMARRVAGQLTQTMSPGGEQMIELRLTPEELGAIKYRMVLTETGATIVVQADRGDTLDLVRRHLESLQREFLRAGFEDTTFTFERGSSGDDTSDHPNAGDTVPLPIELDDAANAPQIHPILNLSARGLDIRL